MSAINLGTQIPNSIVTLEQLLVWAGVTLCRLNPTLQVLEAENRTEYVMQNGIFVAADQSTRMQIRASVALDPNYVTDRTKKLWMFAQEFANTQIPAAFTSN